MKASIKWNLVVATMIITITPVSAQETATGIASHRYEHPGPGNRIFVGANYRKLWAMPVNLKVFRLTEVKGGLTIKELGGGMQTKSLHLEDKKGTKWVLRSLDKSVDKAMDAVGIKDKHIRSLSQKMISAANPYGAVTIAPMAKALGVLSTEPEVYYIPDDPAFGEYRSMFANTVCLLEKREPVLYDGDDVTGTEKMLHHLEGDKRYKIDTKMLLQARLLDMLVGDWDRHDVQWKWEYHKLNNETVILYPIPKDHDQAYFNSTGLFINMIRPFNVHMVVGFRKHMKLTALNYKAWHFDKTLLKDLSKDDWRNGVQIFQSALSDAVIMQAVQRLPAEVYKAEGQHLYKLLRIRRDKMLPAVIHYYHFLQTHPNKIAREEKKEQEKMDRAKKIKDSH